MQDTLLDDATLTSEAFAPAPPTLGVTSLVTADDGLKLRSGPASSSEVRTVIANNAEFIAAPGEHGDWVPGYADGQSGWVAAQYLTAPEALPVVNTSNWNLKVWQGATLSDTNLRNQPSTTARTTRTITHGTPVTVVRWVEGEAVIDDDDTWAEMDDGTFAYVRNLGRSAPVQAPPVPNDAPTSGRWIDVHLTQQLMVAYEGRTVQRVTVMTSGRPGWDTPAGMFAINTRVPNETMESGSIGAESFYKLEDVLYTQYFTDVGHALHFAWWKTPETIGRPGSHGCLNLLLEEAKFYWDWATIGTPVYCHF
jgi:lipoprotein-anchoring transpeptidase ErfK/SrfK